MDYQSKKMVLQNKSEHPNEMSLVCPICSGNRDILSIFALEYSMKILKWKVFVLYRQLLTFCRVSSVNHQYL